MDSNTITQKTENSEIPYKEIYQWSSELTAEQEAAPGYYLWTDEDRKLLFRLMNTRGNLIAVIGLQGSGKTALKEALSSELSKKRSKHFLSKAFSRDFFSFLEHLISVMSLGIKRTNESSPLSIEIPC